MDWFSELRSVKLNLPLLCINEEGIERKRLTEEVITNIERKLKENICKCVVLDARYSDKPTLIDALIKKHITKDLNDTESYYIVGDSDSKEISRDSNEITVPTQNWKHLGYIRLYLSPLDYLHYLKQERHKILPEVTILVMNNVTELDTKKIRSVLLDYGPQFRTGSFLMVFNDSPNVLCPTFEHCKWCYNDSRRTTIKRSRIDVRKKVFRISASQIMKDVEKDEDLDDYDLSKPDGFNKLLQTIEELTDISELAAEYMSEFENFQRMLESKNFMVKFEEEIQKNIDNYADKLEDGKEDLENEIVKSENESKFKIMSRLEAVLKMDYSSEETLNDLNKTTEKENGTVEAEKSETEMTINPDESNEEEIDATEVKKTGSETDIQSNAEIITSINYTEVNTEINNEIKSQFHEELENFEENIEKQLLENLKGDHPEMEDSLKDLFFNEFYNKTDIENNFFEKVDDLLPIQKTNNVNYIVKRPGTSVKEVVKQIEQAIVQAFEVIKEALEMFIKNIKEKAKECVKEISKSVSKLIKASRKSVIVRLKNDIRKQRPLIYDIVKEETKPIMRASRRNSITVHTDDVVNNLPEVSKIALGLKNQVESGIPDLWTNREGLDIFENLKEDLSSAINSFSRIYDTELQDLYQMYRRERFYQNFEKNIYAKETSTEVLDFSNRKSGAEAGAKIAATKGSAGIALGRLAGTMKALLSPGTKVVQTQQLRLVETQKLRKVKQNEIREELMLTINRITDQVIDCLLDVVDKNWNNFNVR